MVHSRMVASATTERNGTSPPGHGLFGQPRIARSASALSTIGRTADRSLSLAGRAEQGEAGACPVLANDDRRIGLSPAEIETVATSLLVREAEEEPTVDRRSVSSLLGLTRSSKRSAASVKDEGEGSRQTAASRRSQERSAKENRARVNSRERPRLVTVGSCFPRATSISLAPCSSLLCAGCAQLGRWGACRAFHSLQGSCGRRHPSRSGPPTRANRVSWRAAAELRHSTNPGLARVKAGRVCAATGRRQTCRGRSVAGHRVPSSERAGVVIDGLESRSAAEVLFSSRARWWAAIVRR